MSKPFNLPISIASIPRAPEKAERYRALNEREQAENICLDILGAFLQRYQEGGRT